MSSILGSAPSRRTPSALSKDEIYALRRVLVKRLQAATRGIRLRERRAAQRGFTEGWREAVSAAALPLVAACVRGQAQAEGRWGVLGQLASEQELTRPESGVFAKSDNGPAVSVTISEKVSSSPAGGTARTRPFGGSRPGPERKERQVELFGSALVVQPL